VTVKMDRRTGRIVEGDRAPYRRVEGDEGGDYVPQRAWVVAIKRRVENALASWLDEVSDQKGYAERARALNGLDYKRIVFRLSGPHIAAGGAPVDPGVIEAAFLSGVRPPSRDEPLVLEAALAGARRYAWQQPTVAQARQASTPVLDSGTLYAAVAEGVGDAFSEASRGSDEARRIALSFDKLKITSELVGEAFTAGVPAYARPGGEVRSEFAEVLDRAVTSFLEHAGAWWDGGRR